jgi:hypothetical protein
LGLILGLLGLLGLGGGGFYYSKININKNGNNTQSMNNSPGGTQIQLNDVVNSPVDLNINRQATYNWVNKGSFKSVQNSKLFRTELIFQASDGILPPLVCLNIQINTKILRIDRGVNAMIGTTKDGMNCFSSPSRYETVGVITNSKPSITKAVLISE